MTPPVETIRAGIPDAIWTPDLEAALADAVASAAAARPGLGIAAATFAGYLLDRCEDDDLVAWLGGAALDDLYLACGCVGGDPAALAAFARELEPVLRAAIARLALPAAEVADVLADVRARLLVERRLGDYGGRGELRTWLRVVATRAGLNALRRQRRSSGHPAELAVLVAHLGDPEAALIAQQLRSELRDAFAAAVATLEIRERNLLRQQLIDDLTVEELGAFYRVHRATAARWVARAREKVWTATVRELRAHLAVTPAQLESLLAAVRTGLDLSLERVLAA